MRCILFTRAHSTPLAPLALVLADARPLALLAIVPRVLVLLSWPGVTCGRGRCCDAGFADACGVIGQKLLAVSVLSDEPDSHFRQLFLKDPLNSK